MIDVKNLYENDGWWIDYQPIINAFGNVAIQVEDDDYSGDTRVLYDNGSEIGHLVFGWGSCSGCDALQACDDYEELQELCNELQSKIIWFSNAKEALEWFTTRDWELQWDWHEEETQKYIDMVKKYLSEKAGE